MFLGHNLFGGFQGGRQLLLGKKGIGIISSVRLFSRVHQTLPRMLFKR
ncbi:MAG: hypothetical protein ACYDEJ_10590 [Desulfitobacteriaceae bacterium]